MPYAPFAGPMKITIEHEDCGSKLGEWPYERAGNPSAWGDGLAHEAIGEWFSGGEVRIPLWLVAVGGAVAWWKWKKR